MINVNFHYRGLLWNSLKPLEEKVKVISAGLWILQQLPLESHSGSLLNSCVFCVRHVSRCSAFPQLGFSWITYTVENSLHSSVILTDSSSMLHLQFSVLPSNQRFILFDLAFCSISVRLLFAPPTPSTLQFVLPPHPQASIISLSSSLSSYRVWIHPIAPSPFSAPSPRRCW